MIIAKYVQTPESVSATYSREALPQALSRSPQHPILLGKIIVTTARTKATRGTPKLELSPERYPDEAALIEASRIAWDGLLRNRRVLGTQLGEAFARAGRATIQIPAQQLVGTAYVELPTPEERAALETIHNEIAERHYYSRTDRKGGQAQ